MEGLSKDKLCSLPKYGLLGRGVWLVGGAVAEDEGKERGRHLCPGLAP